MQNPAASTAKLPPSKAAFKTLCMFRGLVGLARIGHLPNSLQQEWGMAALKYNRKNTHKTRPLQPSPACKFGQLTLQTSSCCPVAKPGCSEKTDWDRSVGTHKTLLRHPEIYWVNELHQDMWLRYRSPFKRLNWCCVNKQTVKEMAETLFPSHLFPLLLLLPLSHFWASVPSPKVLKQQSSKVLWGGSMLGSIFSRYMIAHSREKGGWRQEL